MMRLTVTFALVLQMVKYMLKFVIKVVLFPLIDTGSNISLYMIFYMRIIYIIHLHMYW